MLILGRPGWSTAAPRRPTPSPYTSRETFDMTQLLPIADSIVVSDRNIQLSPLLQLPGEVRTLIFTFVLGGHDIQLNHRMRNFEIRPYHTAACLSSGGQRSFLNLTLVSRQIYIETAMLPFVANTWVFISDPELCQKGLAQRLLPQQANAITTAKCKPETIFYEFREGPIESRHCLKTFAHLQGLMCLIVDLRDVHLTAGEKECMLQKVAAVQGKKDLKLVCEGSMRLEYVSPFD
ncbi:hypothetical protein HBI56_211890 [Parastagonospora nodorum]|uniref:Uncharacterized protein n=1 Tax=Phaeosphaeria nodorum (strain SN15 / ATCC MYA-4574 / FGSC 10173) TaxID=321614 RepID=A0A7U2I129_PHANO|nr:hypothetical protein HBH56_212480 [Parastagonospora nodorum]QRC97933.1 hypothetical protein JI435_152650 [Parastagonospora nodorum SN15]KAH3923014.1 hypothetical protein HBH54_214150 [Parastagonospora nodorum]KAH3941832.1 hypothetical protein HBH53_197940 [Parastagonospora nodorum]KAH3960935.1 hypothetical protein HBH51_187750 [Parastagonospora nodorum]